MGVLDGGWQGEVSWRLGEGISGPSYVRNGVEQIAGLIYRTIVRQAEFVPADSDA